MKILAFSGSPRMKKGNTEKILTPFLEGAREAGSEVEVVYLRRMKLQPCIGCFNCWFRTPGICSINDDIHLLRAKMMESDVLVFATPVHLFSCSGYMKILMDRLLFPFTMPEFLLIDDKVYHPARCPERKWKTILIANGAFDGEDVFKPLTDTYERMMQNVIDEEGKSIFQPVGNITVGFAELFTDEEIELNCAAFFTCMKQAGKKLVTQGFIPDDILRLVNMPLYYFVEMSREQAVDKVNSIITESVDKYILYSNS